MTNPTGTRNQRRTNHFYCQIVGTVLASNLNLGE